MLTVRGTNLGYIQQPKMFAFVPMEGGEFYPTDSTVSLLQSSDEQVRAEIVISMFIACLLSQQSELKQQGTDWSEMAKATQNRVQWRGVVGGLCSTGSDGHK